MLKKTLLVTLISGSLLTGCDSFEDPKAKLEQAYLAEHQELEAVVSQIREQGLNAVAKTAETGSLAACVAGKLDADPMGALVEIEGALQESVDLAQLVESISQLSEQEITLNNLSDMLQQGTDALAYVKHLLENSSVNELKQQLSDSLNNAQSTSQDIGSMLRSHLESCERSLSKN